MSHANPAVTEVNYRLANGHQVTGLVCRVRDPKNSSVLWRRGDWGELSRRITEKDILRFAQLSQDTQWIHTNVDRATEKFGGLVAHGIFTVSLVSALYGNIFPGPGTDVNALIAYFLQADLRFKNIVKAGDRITARATITRFKPNGVMYLNTVVTRGDGEIVVEGSSRLMLRPPK